MTVTVNMIPDELDEVRIEYVLALVERVRQWPVDRDATRICDRIERNLALLTEHPTDLFELVRFVHELHHEDQSAPDARREFDPEHADWTPEMAPLSDSEPIGPSLDSAPQSSEAEAVAEPPPNIPDSIPDGHIVTSDSGTEPPAETAADHASVIPDDIPDVDVAVEELIDAFEEGRVVVPVRRTTVPIRPLSSPKAICNPGCGGSFTAGAAFASHQRNCFDYAVWRSENPPTEIPAAFATALPASAEVDPDAARAEFEARRRRNAEAAVERTRATLRGEEPQSLPPRQAQIVEALRAEFGNQKAAGKRIGISVANVNAQLREMRERGRVPADVLAMLDARKATR